MRQVMHKYKNLRDQRIRDSRCPRLEEISEDELWFDGDSLLWFVWVGHFNLLGMKPCWCRGSSFGSLGVRGPSSSFLLWMLERMRFSWDEGELWLLLFVLAFFCFTTSPLVLFYRPSPKIEPLRVVGDVFEIWNLKRLPLQLQSVDLSFF